MKTILLWGGSLACAAFVFSTTCPAADNYLGAATVLQQLAGAASPDAKPQDESSETFQLKRAIEEFKKQVATLKPEEAAQTWLSLLNRQWKPPPTVTRQGLGETSGKDAFDPREIWNALPPPTTWEPLRRAVEARPAAKGKMVVRELALRLFAHTLAADRAAQTKDIAELEALFAKLSEDENYELASVLDRIGEVMMERSDDAEATMKTLERRLAREAGESYRQELSFPDLVSLAGKEKAEAFLRRALPKVNGEIQVEQGEETQKLARKLALEMVEQLKSPQWKLACSLETGALYEALEKKFAKAEETGTDTPPEPGVPVLDHVRQLNRPRGSQREAQTYYFLGLIVSGRTQDAVAMAQKLGRGDNVYLPADALKSLERAGHTRAIHTFFVELLSQTPDLPFWDEYIRLAAKIGETSKMLELARVAAARDDLSNEPRNLIRQNLYRALLAADQVDEGIKEIRQTLANKDIKLGGRYEADAAERGGLAITLAQLGQLLNRPELVQEGIGQAVSALKSNPSNADVYGSDALPVRLAALLAELGRGPEAEAVLVGSLVATAQPHDYNGERNASAFSLSRLAELYHQAGRHADVIQLLDQSPDWGAKDLASLNLRDYDSGAYGAKEDRASSKLSRFAASSLLATGRKTEARKIVDALLDTDGGFDPAYELLIQIGGGDLIARLDAVFAHDQFEERPLIWKALLLQQAGKLEEAEAAARRAISIDPSDGEQGPGRRMRAYAVLAAIREARGDKQQADFFREAVNAIRLSEKADRYSEAGLLKQAVTMYQDSLTHFADAYCVQARLALQLSELGLHEQAEEHYRRAYELMPDSFGRVESHCFGCERAFDGERAQSVAEKVFTTLARNKPEKPQVHYLLGYLREEQGRYTDALARYREAVRLDPDYLNAWKHIQSVGGQHHLPMADQDAVALNLLRLDPLGRHDAGGDLSNVTDLRALWHAVETAAKLLPPAVELLYPLAASKTKLEKEEKESRSGRGRSCNHYARFGNLSGAENRLQPAMVLMRNNLIAAVQPILADYGGRFSDE